MVVIVIIIYGDVCIGVGYELGVFEGIGLGVGEFLCL